MNKKLAALTAVAVLGVPFLGGCFGGGDNTDGTTSAKQQETTTAGNDEPGHVTDEGGLRKTVVYVDNDFNVSDESGTFEYTIKSIRLEKISASTEVAARTYGIEEGQEAALLTLNLSAKNTGYESVNCYISRAKLTTEQGGTAEPNSMVGTYIDGHFVSSQEKEGSNVYVFKNTKAEDIKNLTLEISAPKDNDFKPVGDEVEFEFSIYK